MYTVHEYTARSDIKKSAMALTLSGSAVCHLLFFAIIFFFPGLGQTNKLNNPPVIDINFVSIPEEEMLPPDYDVSESEMDISDRMETKEAMDHSAPEAIQHPETIFEPKKFKPLAPIEQPKTYEPLIPNPEMIQPKKKTEPAPTTAPEIKPIQRPEIKKIEPIKTPPKPEKPKVKRSLKKRTIKKQQIVKNKEKRHLNDAFRQLEQKVRIKEARQRIQQTGNEKSDVELMDIYKAKIISKINRNWAVPYQMIQGTEKATLVIKILRNGHIPENEIHFEKKSGNMYFDNSALNAIKKSNPLPALPSPYLSPVYGPVGLNFTPSGLK